MKLTYYLIMIILISCSSAPFSGKKFDNIEPFDDKGLFTLLKWQIGSISNSESWPKEINNKQLLPIKSRSKELIITVINHATILIQIENLNILTDPHFSKRASPVQFLGPKRVVKPGIEFKNIPPIDIILISHNHYDHLDLDTLTRFHKRDNPKIYAGLRTKEFLEDNKIKNSFDLDWWQSTQEQSIKITFVPAQHWSARGLFDKREMLWGGFYIKSSERKIYFAGDTGYGKFFKMIKERLGSPEIALLPIGAYEPRWFMKNAHMNPDDAIKAFIDLEAKKMIGMHFGTFKLTDEGIDRPAKDLGVAIEKYKQNPSLFIVPSFGKAYTDL